MRYPGRALRCLGSEVRASDLLADNQAYAYLNKPLPELQELTFSGIDDIDDLFTQFIDSRKNAG